MPTAASKLTHIILNTAASGVMQRPAEAVLKAMANLTRLSAELPGMPALRCASAEDGWWTVYHGDAPVTTCVTVVEAGRAESAWRLLEDAYFNASDGGAEGLVEGAYCEMPEQTPWAGTIVWPAAVRLVGEMSWITQYNLHRAWLQIEAFEVQQRAGGEQQAS